VREFVQPLQKVKVIGSLTRLQINAIAKTVNVPPDIPFVDFAATYRRAYALGLKGCTVYRPNPVTGAILTASPTALAASPTAERCCELPGA